MQDVTGKNFGLLISYLIPGFVTLWGIGYLSTTVRGWLGAVAGESPTVGGFLYVTVGSVGAGMIVSTIRWMLIDELHHRTGIPRRQWDFSRLSDNLAAYDVLGENHYKFYLFHANLLIAAPIAYVAWRLGAGFAAAPFGWPELLLVALLPILYLGSRDTLKRYYSRLDRLLGGREH